jgi:hypothetical protein
MTDDHTEVHIRVDTGNAIGMALVFAAATMHPNWEADHIGGYVIRFGSGPGPRSIDGLERWFLANHPDLAKGIMARVRADDIYRRWQLGCSLWLGSGLSH